MEPPPQDHESYRSVTLTRSTLCMEVGPSASNQRSTNLESMSRCKLFEIRRSITTGERSGIED